MDTRDYKDIIRRAEESSELDFPKIIEIQTQSMCNGFCKVCPYGTFDMKHSVMSDETLSKILDEIIRNKDKVKKVIPYLNNEPSLEKRIISILRKLKKNDIFVELSTNISNWSEDDLRLLVDEHLIDDMRVSFFGHNKKIYEMMMTGLNFDKNYAKVKLLLDYNRKSANGLDIELIVVLLPELNVQEIKEGLNKLFDNPKIHFFGFLDRCGMVKGLSNSKVEDKSCEIAGCSLNYPFERCFIVASGDVVICSQDWGQEIVIGNINRNSIHEIWNSERAKHIRRILLGLDKCPSDFLCKKCKLAILKQEGKELLNFNGDRYVDKNDKKLIK